MAAHSEILLSKCAQFREEGKFVDVRLKVGEDLFPAHRIVLAANSDYFHAMFVHDMKESNQEVIELKDESISAAALKIVMDGIYSGNLHINNENVFEVLSAADHLQLTSIVQQCCDFLQSEFVQLQFDVETYCRICKIADRHGLTDLQDATRCTMASMYKEICESEEFLSHIDADQLWFLLSRDDLTAPSETFVFKSVMQWIKYKKEERMPLASKVIGAVRLGLVDIGDVIEELDTEEMQRVPEIHMLLYDSFRYNYRPSNSSKFALEKAKPRSMSQVLVAILPQNPMQYFDVQTKTWKTLPSMTQLPEATKCFAAEYAGNYLYVAARNGNGFANYRYHVVSNTWETLPPFIGLANQINCLCCIEDHIYAINQSQVTFRYNVNTNKWQCISKTSAFYNMHMQPTTFCNKAAVVFKSCVYVIYGQGERTSERPGVNWRNIRVAVLYCFDPKRNLWEQKATTKGNHFGSSLFVVNNRLYVAGGQCSVHVATGEPSGGVASVEVYDEQNHTWSIVDQPHIPPNNLGAVEVEGRVYFIINNLPIDLGIRIPPGEVYAVPLDEWDNLGKVNKNAVLCYMPVKTEHLTAE